MARVLASEKTRNELKEMMAGAGMADRSSLVRQAARLIVEEALEAEAEDVLGRGYYERGAVGRGYRSGYRQLFSRALGSKLRELRPDHENGGGQNNRPRRPDPNFVCGVNGSSRARRSKQHRRGTGHRAWHGAPVRQRACAGGFSRLGVSNSR